MALLLRFSPSERALRSVDEHPGIVCVVFVDGDLSFAIEHRILPDVPEGRPGVTYEPTGDEHLIALPDAVAACEGGEELNGLMSILLGFLRTRVETVVPTLAFEQLRGPIEFAIEVRDAVGDELDARGLTEPTS